MKTLFVISMFIICLQAQAGTESPVLREWLRQMCGDCTYYKGPREIDNYQDKGEGKYIRLKVQNRLIEARVEYLSPDSISMKDVRIVLSENPVRYGYYLDDKDTKEFHKKAANFCKLAFGPSYIMDTGTGVGPKQDGRVHNISCRSISDAVYLLSYGTRMSIRRTLGLDDSDRSVGKVFYEERLSPKKSSGQKASAQ